MIQKILCIAKKYSLCDCEERSCWQSVSQRGGALANRMRWRGYNEGGLGCRERTAKVGGAKVRARSSGSRARRRRGGQQQVQEQAATSKALVFRPPRQGRGHLENPRSPTRPHRSEEGSFRRREKGRCGPSSSSTTPVRPATQGHACRKTTGCVTDRVPKMKLQNLLRICATGCQ